MAALALQLDTQPLHPGALPAIHAVAVAQAWAPYADWVESGSSGA
jgi:uncharacterized protein involved in tolerance to divalent cations